MSGNELLRLLAESRGSRRARWLSDASEDLREILRQLVVRDDSQFPTIVLALKPRPKQDVVMLVASTGKAHCRYFEPA